jgi:hypothetical protein
MTFDDIRARNAIEAISGKWFDLNGNLIRLFSLVSEMTEHSKDDMVFGKRLPQAVINRDNFAALMGDISFSR